MKDARRLLVLAPHADDELLGCGGTLALAARRGARVHVVVVFDGAAGDPQRRFDPAGYVARREREARSGGARLGVVNYEFWRLPEGHEVPESVLAEHFERLERVVRDVAADALLVPWSGEAHADHATVARAVQLWLERRAPSCEVWGYEVWSPLAADLFVDVSDVWSTKLAALREHYTQYAYRDLAAWSSERARRSGERTLEAFQRLDSPTP